MRSMAVIRYEATLISLVKKIEKEVDFRKAHHIVPARATWRGLRDVLTEEERKILESLVRWGIVKKYDGIHYPSYEIDYLALRKYEREFKQP